MESNERVLSFIAEWFDPHPQITKTYRLKFHCNSNEVEMRDIQTKRIFLKKTRIPPTLKEQDFCVGASILLLSRDLKLIEYADSVTRSLLEDVDERTYIIVPPALYDSVGDISQMVEEAGLTLVDLKSTCLGGAEDVDAAAELLKVDARELNGPEPLVAMSFRGADSIAGVKKLIQSSSFAGLGLSCPVSADEATVYSNFLSNAFSRTTATFEECSCVVIKPHAIKERSVGAIFKDLIDRGFVVSAMAMFRLERAAAAEFMEVYDGVVPEYREMVDEMCSGSVVALEVRLKPRLLQSDAGEGNASTRQEEVVEKLRAHAGPWDINMAKELYSDTIRGRFGRDRIRNAIHCTDLPKDGVVEVEYFFKILAGHQYVDG